MEKVIYRVGRGGLGRAGMPAFRIADICLASNSIPGSCRAGSLLLDRGLPPPAWRQPARLTHDADPTRTVSLLFAMGLLTLGAIRACAGSAIATGIRRRVSFLDLWKLFNIDGSGVVASAGRGLAFTGGRFASFAEALFLRQGLCFKLRLLLLRAETLLLQAVALLPQAEALPLRHRLRFAACLSWPEGFALKPAASMAAPGKDISGSVLTSAGGFVTTARVVASSGGGLASSVGALLLRVETLLLQAELCFFGQRLCFLRQRFCFFSYLTAPVPLPCHRSVEDLA